MKVDGLSNKDIKLQIIAKGLPFDSGLKIDSLEDKIIDYRYDAACELLRTQATQNDDKNKGSKVTIDRAALDEKREKLRNKYQENQEKITRG
jgi:hypothetical protein